MSLDCYLSDNWSVNKEKRIVFIHYHKGGSYAFLAYFIGNCRLLHSLRW
jgi:hypothetical protein